MVHCSVLLICSNILYIGNNMFHIIRRPIDKRNLSMGDHWSCSTQWSVQSRGVQWTQKTGPWFRDLLKTACPMAHVLTVSAWKVIRFVDKFPHLLLLSFSEQGCLSFRRKTHLSCPSWKLHSLATPSWMLIQLTYLSQKEMACARSKSHRALAWSSMEGWEVGWVSKKGR